MSPEPAPLHVATAIPDRGEQAAADLVERLARALHRFGTPAHRLEEAMGLVARRLGLAVEFFSTPTAIFTAFHHPRLDRTRLMRVEPGEVNLEKLSRLDRELSRLMATPEDGSAIDTAAIAHRVDAIVDAPVRYGAAETTFAFAFASGSAAHFFGGGLAEIVLSTFVGLGIGLLALLVERWSRAGRLFEMLAALFATWSAGVAAAVVPGLAPFVVVLAGLIVLIPGLTLTIAMTELAARHLMSGSSRLAGALLVFLTLGFGVALGQRLGELTAGPPAAPPAPLPLPPWSEGLALLVSAVAFTVLFRARPKDAGWILLAATVALLGARTGAAWLGPQLGALVGAILVGLAGNAHARLFDRPSAVTQVPGLMLLVPGSLGFRSVAALLENDTLSGVQTAFSMILVAVGLVVGLLLANVILPPRRTL